MKHYINNCFGEMEEISPDLGGYICYEDHIQAMSECERLAKKAFLDQSDSYWKIEYDRIMKDYGHLFMGII